MEQKAISLSQICRQEFNREELIGLLLQKTEERYYQLKRGRSDLLRKEYLTKLYWKDEIHVFRSNESFFNGKIIGVEQSGKLVVALEEGRKSFDFKEITFIK